MEFERPNPMFSSKPQDSFYVAPRAPSQEPVLRISYGEFTADITYTGLHHLNSCGGWGDRESAFRTEDDRLSHWLRVIEEKMARDGADRHHDD